MKDYWNIADVMVIAVSISFVILDLSITNNKALKNILNLRGVFRLLRVFILIRKLNVVRLKREIRQRTVTSSGYDLRSPLEKVLEILGDVRNAIDLDEVKMVQDMNYCIKMISSNKLYEAELDIEEIEEGRENDKTGPS